MEFERFDIAWPVLLKPVRHENARGLFSETFRADAFAREVSRLAFVQENHARS